MAPSLKFLLIIVVLLYFMLTVHADGFIEEMTYLNGFNGELMCADTKCNNTLCTFDKVYQDCRCDPLCRVYRDCCHDTQGCSILEKDMNSTIPSFQCHNPVLWDLNIIRGVDEERWYWYWMVVDCPSDWLNEGDDDTASLRQTIQDKCINNDANLPVSDRFTGFDYRNKHCALCNGVELENILYWGYNYSCSIALNDIARNDTDFVLTQSEIDEYCKFINFTRPVFNIVETSIVSSTPRYCFPSQPRTCLDPVALQNITGFYRSDTEYNTLKANCEQGTTQAFVATVEQSVGDFPYSNAYCALCNGNKASDLYCYMVGYAAGGTSGIVFSLFLDIHQNGQLTLTSEVLTAKTSLVCPQNQVYDPLQKACRSTVLLDCLNRTENIVYVLDDVSCERISCSGSLIILDNSTTFAYNDSGTVVYVNEVYQIEFNTTEGEPVICVNFSANGTLTINTTVSTETYPIGYYVLTYIGCTLSVIGCVLVLITNSVFKELRSLPSKLLMNLAVAILVTNLLIILGGPVTAAFSENVKLCVSTAIFLHFFCLSQFSWMSVMSTEIVHSFYNANKLRPKDQFPAYNKLLGFYIVIGWTIPLIITVVTIAVNFSTEYLVLYGVTEDGRVGSCWINHFESLIVAFIIPIATALTYNLVTFVIVCIQLIRGRCLQKELNSGKFPYFRASIAIFSVSGLTWLFGFVAILTRAQWPWYPFIALNSIQGLLIFLAFLCTKKVGKLYLSLLTTCTRKVPETTSGTQDP